MAEPYQQDDYLLDQHAQSQHGGHACVLRRAQQRGVPLARPRHHGQNPVGANCEFGNVFGASCEFGDVFGASCEFGNVFWRQLFIYMWFSRQL